MSRTTSAARSTARSSSRRARRPATCPAGAARASSERPVYRTIGTLTYGVVDRHRRVGKGARHGCLPRQSSLVGAVPARRRNNASWVERAWARRARKTESRRCYWIARLCPPYALRAVTLPARPQLLARERRALDQGPQLRP